MKRQRRFLSYLIITSLIVLGGCYYDNAEELYPNQENCAETVSYATDVEPIISANCAIPSCHSNAQNPTLGSYADVSANAERVKIRVTEGTMPPPSSPDLTAEEIELIRCWVDQGAQDN